jgi:hypothetical protein
MKTGKSVAPFEPKSRHKNICSLFHSAHYFIFTWLDALFTFDECGTLPRGKIKSRVRAPLARTSTLCVVECKKLYLDTDRGVQLTQKPLKQWAVELMKAQRKL